MRVEELYRTFRRIFSLEIDEAKVKHCFKKIIAVYENRLFPDLTYLEHTIDALRIGQSESIWTRPLACAIWYQHSGADYPSIEKGVQNARAELPKLGVSEKDIEDISALIRSTADDEPRGYDGPLLFDANTYARFGVSHDRTTEIVVRGAKLGDHTHDFVQKVVGNQLLSALHGKLYYSGMLKERFDESTRQNIKDTLKHLKYIGKQNPNRRKLK